MKAFLSVFIICYFGLSGCSIDAQAIKTLLPSSSPQEQSESTTLIKGSVIPPNNFSAQDFNVVLLDSARQPILLSGVDAKGAFEFKNLVSANSRIYLQAINQLNPSFILEAVADLPETIENIDFFLDITIQSTALSIVAQNFQELSLKDIKGSSQSLNQMNTTRAKIDQALSESGTVSTLQLFQNPQSIPTPSQSPSPPTTPSSANDSLSSIHWFAPNKGFIGDQFLVTGQDFGNQSELFINDTALTIIQQTPQQLIVKIPEGAQSGQLRLKTSKGTIQTTGTLTILNPDSTSPSPTPSTSPTPTPLSTPTPTPTSSTEARLPLLSNVVPESGLPGSEVTLNGSNFDSNKNNNEVTFNGSKATIVSATEASLTVLVPEVAGQVSIAVRSNSLLSNSKIFNTTAQITSINPTSGATGAIVTISGNGLANTSAVNFNGISATIESITNSLLSVKVPPLSTTGPIHVATSTGTLNSQTFVKVFQVSTFAGTGSGGFGEGTGTGARFNFPKGITADSQGNLYIGDTANHRIRKLTPQGVSSTFAGIGSPGITNGDATTVAEFNSPIGMVFDSSGNLYVADQGNHRIRMITPAGTVSTFAGSGTPAFQNGVGAGADFNNPTGLAIDSNNNLYVADSQNNRIRKITIPGANVTTVAGTGGFGHNDGAVGTAQFIVPMDLTVDSNNDLFIADFGNHVIRKIDMGSNMVSTPAGLQSAPAFQDGSGAGARFNSPSGITIDSNNNLYVADQNNHRIRIVSPSGNVSTFAGNGSTPLLNGNALTAQFNTPEQLVFAGGNLFIVSQVEHRIRKILF